MNSDGGALPATKKQSLKRKKSGYEGEVPEKKKKLSKPKVSAPITNNNNSNNYFKSQKVGSKGIKESLIKYAQAPSIKVTASEMNTFLNSSVTLQPYAKDIDQLEKNYIDQSLHWLWLSLSRNILLFGLGSKKPFLDVFVQKYLTGEDVLSIDGGETNVEDRVIKSLLNTIFVSILKIQLKTTGLSYLSPNCQAEIIASALNKHYGRTDTSRAFRFCGFEPKLYIIVHDIGGTALNSAESQLALATLAACPSVCLIATMEHMNTPLLWNEVMCDKFKWAFRHMPTFKNHELPPDFALLTTKVAESYNPETGSHGNSSLQDVLSSLQLNQRQLMGGLCKLICDKHDKKVAELSTSSRRKPTHLEMDKSASISDLFTILKGRMVANSQQHLNNLLKEFLDHKIIIRNDKKKIDNISLMVTDREVRDNVRLFHQ